MLDQLRVHRQIIFDLTTHDLEPLSGCFERLAYVAALYDPRAGRYSHRALCAVYEPSRVHEVLSECHGEIFERLLECSLAEQEEDLLKYLKRLPEDSPEQVRLDLQRAESWVPPQAPDYLKELYRSNLAVLAELLPKQLPTARSDN